MVRAGRNAKEILIPKIEITGLGDYTRNVGYKTGSAFASRRRERSTSRLRDTPVLQD